MLTFIIINSILFKELIFIALVIRWN